MVEKDLIIIGCGPAGLKAGEIAESRQLDYLILEKGEIGGAWRTIRSDMPMLSPCHPQRDWTSISDKFPIWKLDVQRPYCSAAEFVEYMDQFYRHFNLNVHSNETVTRVAHNSGLFIVETDNRQYHAKMVLVLTGFFSNPYIPELPGADAEVVMHSHLYQDQNKFKQQRVFIIGGGNSAAEIAIELAGKSQVYLVTRDELKFFSKTKNLCDIRGISESYLLELISMGLIRYFPNTTVKQLEKNSIILSNGRKYFTHYVIFATGYRPDLELIKIDGFQTIENGYPRIDSLGESTTVHNLFFGGPLAYNKLSNIFIHGFIKTIPQTMNEIENRLR